jgi:hypothetical protein
VITRVPPVTDADHTRDANLLKADITELDLITKGPRDGHIHNERWIVAGVEAKPQYGNPGIVTVWSPCCGRPRYRLAHGYAFSCPACGWWWRYHYADDHITRAVSLGKTRP